MHFPALLAALALATLPASALERPLSVGLGTTPQACEQRCAENRRCGGWTFTLLSETSGVARCELARRTESFAPSLPLPVTPEKVSAITTPATVAPPVSAAPASGPPELPVPPVTLRQDVTPTSPPEELLGAPRNMPFRDRIALDTVPRYSVQGSVIMPQDVQP